MYFAVMVWIMIQSLFYYYLSFRFSGSFICYYSKNENYSKDFGVVRG